MNIFSMNSIFYRVISRLGELIVLNLLFLLFSIPVVTIGASLTALFTVTQKMYRNESGYLSKDFLKAFWSNFKQATVMELIVVGIGVLLYFDIMISNILGGTLGSVLKIVFLFFGMVYLSVISYVFAVLSRFENSIINTFKNAFWMAMGYLPLTISILVIECIPLFLIFYKQSLFWYLLPVMITIGFAAIIYLSTGILNYIFEKYIPENHDFE